MKPRRLCRIVGHRWDTAPDRQCHRPLETSVLVGGPGHWRAERRYVTWRSDAVCTRCGEVRDWSPA